MENAAASEPKTDPEANKATDQQSVSSRTGLMEGLLRASAEVAHQTVASISPLPAYPQAMPLNLSPAPAQQEATTTSSFGTAALVGAAVTSIVAMPEPGEGEKQESNTWTPERIAQSKKSLMEKLTEKINIIKEAYETKEYGNMTIRNSFLLLTNSYFYLKGAPPMERVKMRLEIIDLFFETKVISILIKIFAELVDQSIPTKFKKDGEVCQEWLRPSRSILGIMFNSSDASTDFCKELTRDDTFLETLLKVIRELRTDYFNGELNDDVTNFLRCSIATSYNLVMQGDGTDIVDRVREIGLADAIRPYLNSSLERMRASALLFFIYVANEEEAPQTCADEVSMQFVLTNLKTAMKSHDKRGRGFSNMELFRAVGKLAALDVNKAKLAELGTLDLMKTALIDGDDEEVQAAIEILWQLAFHPVNARQIKQTMWEKMESLSSQSENPAIQKAAFGLMWVVEEKAGDFQSSTRRHVPKSARTRTPHDPADLDEETERNKSKNKRFFAKFASRAPPLPPAPPRSSSCSVAPRPPPPPPGAPAPLGIKAIDGRQEVPVTPEPVSDKHIMISYEWGNQSKIIKLKDFIIAKGHKVWLDVDSMGGNTLDSMAQAVENAWLILVSVSRKYKESQNCRMEAEYAFRLKKNFIPLMVERYRPDGWLGFLVGAKLYYDFSGKYPFEEKANELLSAINKLIGGDIEEDLKPPSETKSRSEVDGLPVPSDDIKVEKVTPLAAAPVKNMDYLDSWGSTEVSAWCKDNKLEWTNLLSVTGKELKFLIRVHRECPNFFYRCVETKLNLRTLTEMADFVNALERL